MPQTGQVYAQEITLLSADDYPQNRLIIEAMFHAHPVRIVSVATGAEAIQACVLQRFDGVLMDVQLGSDNGYDIVREVRRAGLNQDTPVLFLTGQEPLLRDLASIPGPACEVVLKPFSPSALVSRVLALVAAHRAELTHNELSVRPATEAISRRRTS